MGRNRSVSEVKAKFSEYVREAEHGDPVIITRRGRAVAALVRSDDFDQLERLRAEGADEGLASIAGGWEESEELVQLVEANSRSRATLEE